MNCVENYFIKNNIIYIEIRIEILEILNQKHYNSNYSDDLVFNFLDNKFSSILHKTFSQKIVLWYSEVITKEILILIHDYFSNKCCNIENIILLASTSGLNKFYNSYCNLNQCLGMHIVEVPMTNSCHEKYYQNLSKKTFKKDFKKLFSYYGGTYEVDPPERTFLSLFVAQFKNYSIIEMLGDVSKLENLKNWLEKETFFLDSSFIEKYENLYNQFINKNLKLDKKLTLEIDKPPVINEIFGHGNRQEILDNYCLFNICRETVNFQPFSFISEKTFRCFYNYLIPIPITGDEIITDLTDYEFWIDETIFDYSYLQETYFKNRMNKLEHSLSLITKLDNRDLVDFYYQNIEKFNHNQELIINWPSIIDKTFDKKIKSIL